MTVMFPPGVRLNRTRVAMTTQLSRDVEGWQKSIAAAVMSGAGMVIVSDPTIPAGGRVEESRLQAGAVLMGAALTSARQVGSRALVAVAEPVSREVLTDAVFVESLGRLSLWEGVLAGVEAHTPTEVDAVVASSAAYFVVDWRVDGLVAHAAEAAGARPDLVWFVKGLDSLGELEQAVDIGARRVWLDESNADLAQWSTYLRGVWRVDPAMRALIPGRLATRRLL
ncbi:MAG: hypothetical protein LBN10_00070 [Propionibacteriaceae bacterium]|jgi:hypothetical protein|nr:hypothetical protein [Propionibacteriaceae bacterium]